ncbi:MAG: PCYCGC domain-containing protein [Calditerricola sp.]|nr:hypothetical protein [Bacillota bacterium]MCG0314827.1 PCYCGC domain-containing protein [Calditerricola sp.]
MARRGKGKPLLAALLLSTLLAGCSNGAGSHEGANPAIHTAPNGDLREVTASVDTLPTFLDDKPEPIRATYRLAGRHADVLRWMPCTCGCGPSAGHRSNLDCFIHEIRPDGSVIWDDHATRCDTCLRIAAEAAHLAESGKSTQEIRQHIDAKYGKYGPPTPTPQPPAS